MAKNKLILIGGGGHAKACVDVIISISGGYDIFGYIDINPTGLFDIPYLGNDSTIIEYSEKCKFFICVGQIKNSEIRKKLFDNLKQIDAELAIIISPNAYVSKRASLGAGTIVMHGAIIQTDVQIGSNCIINDNSLIEHGAFIGNNCHVSTSATINGDVKIGNNVFIGSGAVLKNGISIADNTIVGMGAIVTRDTTLGETIVGNPAKTLNFNE